MKRIRIAYLIDDLSYGGAQKQLSLLVRALPPHIDPLVVSLSRFTDPFAGILTGAGIEVVALVRRSHADFLRLVALARTLRGARVEVVHGFLDAANAYGWASARLLRRPVVLSVQSDRLQVGLVGAALPYMLRHADYVTVNSAAGETLLLDRVGVDRGRLALVTNWIGSGNPPSAPARAADGPTIGFVGRLSPEKRVSTLVDAFAILRRRWSGGRLIVMGGGPERAHIERRIAALDIGESVELLAPSPDVKATLARLDCFVLPSAFEGLPNVVIEALAMGVPVVASRVGDLPELVTPGRTGVLVDSVEPEAFAAAIAAVVDDGELRSAVRSEGPRLVRERFSIERALEKLVPVYESLAAKRTRDR